MVDRRGRANGWTLYLLLAACLLPVIVPTGPAQTAIIDGLNLIAIAAFGFAVLAKRQTLRVPFLGPVLLMAVGSLIATANAEMPGESLLTLVQDTYLFVWFVVLVNVLQGRRDMVGFRLAWVWAADIVALLGIWLLLSQTHGTPMDLLKARGARALGTFSEPDDFADYLVMSVFMVLSLSQDAGRLWRWGSIALLTLAIVATKANGALMALAVGLMAWAMTRAWTRRLSPGGLLAAALLVGTLGLAVAWLNVGLGAGSAELEALQANTFMSRATHSSESRMKIWGQLGRAYWEKPLGIGPGNSRWLTLSVEDRDRPNSQFSKEAHNDYLAYLIERGPLALLGLLAIRLQAFGKIIGWWRRRAARAPGRIPGGALAASAVGALVASSLSSMTIENLHFRHVWVFLAMVCALEAMGAGSRRVGRDESPEEAAAPPDGWVAGVA